jgi:alpha-mannosidase
MTDKEYDIYLKRATGFFGRLPQHFFKESRLLSAVIGCSKEPVAWRDRDTLRYRPVGEKETWGGLWDSAWMKLSGEIPESWRGQPLACLLNLGGEILLFDAAGVPSYNLTNTCVFASQYRKELFQVTDQAVPGRLELTAEVAANGLFGDEMNPDAPAQRCTVGLVEHLKYGLFNREVWQLRLELEVLLGVLMAPRAAGDFCFGSPAYPPGSRRPKQILMTLNRAIDAYGDDPANVGAARAVLAAELKRPAMHSAMKVTAVGHAHIDTAWLWPVRETIRKCARTFSGQLRLMEQYPDYVFGASQAQLYAFVKEHYPALYAKIKRQVAAGRWEIQGGMWVEADANLISGESMVRQFLHGKNFFMDEFGVDVKNLWLPDVFGYSAALPQIIRKSGCDAFLTQKISWNQYNKFPFHCFTWRGLGNYEVLTHFPPEDNYNAMLVPDQLNYGANNLAENWLVDEYLSLYGIGDGGGGPKEEYVERGLLCADLEGSPKVKFGRADDFFARLAKRQPELPIWNGELYMEGHRGTLTTQGRTKRHNRQGEQQLAAAEFLCSALPPAKYPAAEFDRLWKLLLLNQFHDIIPGSSIGEVYAVTEKEHAGLLVAAGRLADEAAAALFTPERDSLVLANTLSYDYAAPVLLPDGWHGASLNGQPLPAQCENGAVWVLPALPPHSLTTLKRTAAPAPAAPAPAGGDLVLENDLVRYEFAPDARLLTGIDKTTGRTVVTTGNELKLYIDIPNANDAWDVDVFYEQEKTQAPQSVSAAKTVAGPVRQVLEFELTVGVSRVWQQVTLAANSKRLDFNTRVEWRESHRMLRVAFATTVQAAEAAYDIQYGFVKRATHRNTSWDLAKFEVAGQRYVDLSDHAHGVALLNNGKYGHKVLENVIDLNLLRSPKWPDATADQGEHRFTYSLLPHTGALVESEVMAEAAALNRAPALFAGHATAVQLPCRKTGGAGVTLEVCKKAEKADGLVIRLVETNGRDSSITLALQPPWSRLQETNLLEWTDGQLLDAAGGTVTLTLKPFEIRTYKLLLE